MNEMNHSLHSSEDSCKVLCVGNGCMLLWLRDAINQDVLKSETDLKSHVFPEH